MAAADNRRMSVTVEEARVQQAHGSWMSVGVHIEDAPAVAVLRQVPATAPSLIGAATRRHREWQPEPEPLRVDRSPIFWPLALVVVLLAAAAVVVAPAGAVALSP